MYSYGIIDIETTGLDPLEDRIIAIGMKSYFPRYDRELDYVEFYNENEEKMINDFWNYTIREHIDYFVGFNFEFDWTFIKLKTVLKYEVEDIDVGEAESMIIDLRRILNRDRFKKNTKLSSYLKFSGIDLGDEISGSQIPELYSRGEIKPILEHLRKDVEGTYQLFLKCLKAGLIE